MNTSKKVVGIVGSYRKGGTIDTVVSEVLAEAENQGAETSKIYLQDRQIEFCTNCRVCLQQPGPERGDCVLEDEMNGILQEIEAADSLVIGAPVNFGNVNALTQRFLERCVCYGYWPWNTPSPQMRKSEATKKAVLISSSAMPGFMARWLSGAIKSLKSLAKMLDAKPIGVIFVGQVISKQGGLSDKIKRQARDLGQELVG
ncbi:flavodoxin family protein [Laspinema olomoucense]|uniref:flavodoxin family protein n=1 Tax=Laspinema olomoucense TaxID=3231600 RepID=UPI0021BA77B6|nr:flavodoxin family protein [Laspinema sp. D3c]MCT7995492.1 flavodoxin family protein [Laspinema sp. D3c]